MQTGEEKLRMGGVQLGSKFRCNVSSSQGFANGSIMDAQNSICMVPVLSTVLDRYFHRLAIFEFLCVPYSVLEPCLSCWNVVSYELNCLFLYCMCALHHVFASLFVVYV